MTATEDHVTDRDARAPRRLAEMTWRRIRESLDDGVRTVLLGVGAIEQHGPHLPVLSDALIARTLADRVGTRIPRVLVGPVLELGVSPHHMAFPGTITIPADLYVEHVGRYVSSLAAHGFERVFAFSGHGGNFAPLARLRDETGGRIDGVEFVPYTDLEAVIAAFASATAADGITAAASGRHAGDAETSMLLALCPELVEMDRAEVGFMGSYDAEPSPFEGVHLLAPNGILGDPRAATAERGERCLRAWEDLLVDFFAAV